MTGAAPSRSSSSGRAGRARRRARRPVREDPLVRLRGLGAEGRQARALGDNWDLKNFDDPVWKKGNLLEVSWGYPGDMAPTRQLVIQKVTGFQVLSIEGHATSVLMNKVARCRTFEDVRRSDVVRKLAQDNGYGPAQQHIEDTEHILPVITQARMTDTQLLRRLDREGFELYVDFDGLHFHHRRLGQRPTRVLRWFTPPETGRTRIEFRDSRGRPAKGGA